MQNQVIFLFAGEGAHSTNIDLSVLKTSPTWPQADAALQKLLGTGADAFLSANSGNHAAPASPLVTTLINVLHGAVHQWWGKIKLLSPTDQLENPVFTMFHVYLDLLVEKWMARHADRAAPCALQHWGGRRRCPGRLQRGRH